MKLLLVGNQKDCHDFVNYASQNSITLFVIAEDEWETALTLDSNEFYNVFSFSDTGQHLVEKIKEAWSVTGRGEKLIRMLTSKVVMRNNVSITTLFSKFLLIDNTVPASDVSSMPQLKNFSFPAVVKPDVGFYSAGVSRVEKLEDVPRAVTIARRINNQISGNKGQIIIEEYLAGDEVAIDGFVHDGEIYPLIRHLKYPKLEGPFFHEESYLSQLVESDYPEKESLERFIRSVGLTSGPFHLEMRQSADGVWHLLECAPRLSGQGLSTNIPFLSLTGKSTYDFLLYPEQLKKRDWLYSDNFVVEFEFAAPQDAILTGMEKVANIINEIPGCQVFSYAKDGDYVLAPPSTLNSLLQVFKKVDNLKQAIEFYSYLKSLEGELFA